MSSGVENRHIGKKYQQLAFKSILMKK